MNSTPGNAASFALLQANRTVAREVENNLQGSGVSPQQLYAHVKSLGTDDANVGEHVRSLASVIGASRRVQAATVSPRSSAIEPGVASSALMDAHRAAAPLLTPAANAADAPSEAGALASNAPINNAARESMFKRMLAVAQEPTATPSYDDGVQQVRVVMMDSGSGGLVAGKTIEQEFDRNGDGKVTFGYVTDHGANSYGSRPPAEIAQLTRETLRYAQDVLNADIIVMACNTATASFPAGREGITVPVVDLINNTSNIMLRQGGERPAMFATAAMSGVPTGDPRPSDPDASRSNGYKTALARQGIELTSVPCPNWARYVNEEYHTDTDRPERIREVVDDVRIQVSKLPLDATAVFLNCTHYPALKEMIEDAVHRRWSREAPGVAPPPIIDPMVEQARAAIDEVTAIRSRGNASGGASGDRVVVTTGNVGNVARQVDKLLPGNSVVFGVNPQFQWPVFDPSSSSFTPRSEYAPIPDAFLKLDVPADAPNFSPATDRVGFKPQDAANTSRLPADVMGGFDLNYTPRGTADDRIHRLRQEAYQIVNTLRPDSRAEALRSIDLVFSQRRGQFGAMPPIKLPDDATTLETNAVERALATFASDQVASVNVGELPAAPTRTAIRTAVRQELERAGVPSERADALLRRSEHGLELWTEDINVQRNDQVHRLAEALSALLVAYPRR